MTWTKQSLRVACVATLLVAGNTTGLEEGCLNSQGVNMTSTGEDSTTPGTRDQQSFRGREDLLLTSPNKQVMRWTPNMFPIRVVIHRSVSPPGARATRQGVWLWNRLVGRRVFEITHVDSLESRTDTSTDMNRVPLRTIVVVQTQLGANHLFTTHGMTRVRSWRLQEGRLYSGTVSLDTEITDPEQSRLVMIHELGHVVGLGHDRLQRSVMYTNALDSWGIIESRDVAWVMSQMPRLRTIRGLMHPTEFNPFGNPHNRFQVYRPGR